MSTDYDTDIRAAVRKLLDGGSALPLLDTDYAKVFDGLVNDAVRVCNEADNNERLRYGQQSWVLSSSFGNPGELLVYSLAALLSYVIAEIHYNTLTASAQGSSSVTNAWADAVLNGKLSVTP